MEPTREDEVLRAGDLEVRPADHLALARRSRAAAVGAGARAARGAGCAGRAGSCRARSSTRRSGAHRCASSDRSVDVYVHKLRSKLARALPECRFIHTHFGFGYRLRAGAFTPFSHGCDPTEDRMDFDEEQPTCCCSPSRRAGVRRRRLRRRRRDSDASGSSSDRSRSAASCQGTIAIDGSSTVAPFTEAAAELFNEENPDVQGHRRHLRHRRRLREVLRRRDRHLRRVAADQGRRGGAGLREGRRQVHRGPGRQRRHRGRDEQGARGRLPDHRPAQAALEQGLEGQVAHRDRPEAARTRSSRSTARAPTRARSTSSPTRSTARRA